MQNIYGRAVTGIPCYRMLTNANFTKRLEAATKDLYSCKFQFQVVLFRLNAVLHVLD